MMHCEKLEKFRIVGVTLWLRRLKWDGAYDILCRVLDSAWEALHQKLKDSQGEGSTASQALLRQLIELSEDSIEPGHALSRAERPWSRR